MIIKVNNVDDANICDEFLTLLIQDERKYDNTIDENFIVKDYFLNMINGENILLLYKDEDIPKGYIFAKKINDYYLIDGLYVDTSFRNMGIAKRLIKEIIKEIHSFGNYKIYINVLKENKIALELYKIIGFSIIEETDSKYHMEYI